MTPSWAREVRYLTAAELDCGPPVVEFDGNAGRSCVQRAAEVCDDGGQNTHVFGPLRSSISRAELVRHHRGQDSGVVVGGRVGYVWHAGVHALFPGQQRAWETQRESSECSAVLADRLAELDGLGSTIENEPPVFDARVAELVVDYVEPARSRAYDELGDGGRAQAIAASWLRQRL